MPIGALFGVGAGAAGAGTAAGLTGMGTGVLSGMVGSNFLPTLIMGTIGMGTLMSSGSQMQAGRAAEENTEFNARVNEFNAQVAEQDALAAERSANYRADALNRENRRKLARQRTLYAAAGVTEEGSPLQLMSEDAGIAAKDVFMTRYAGNVEATRYRNQANLLRSNAGYLRSSGSITRSSYNSGAIGTLVSGLGKMGSSYYTLKRPSYMGDFT